MESEKAKCKNCTDEMIEDMQKVIEYACNVYNEKGNRIRNKCNSWDCEYFCATNGVCCSYGKKEAIALYNAGYRNCKDKVVLDRQEYQKYCAYKIIEPQIKGCLDRELKLEKQVAKLEEQRDRQAYIAEELIQEKHRWTEQARKETAKGFAKELLNFINLCDDMEYSTYEKISNKIDEIAKKFGVEVKE